MTSKEFEEKVKEWGEKYNYNIAIENNHDSVGIVLKDKYTTRMVCIVHKAERFVIDLLWIAYKELPENERNDLFKIVTEFSATKIEEREDEKLFIIPLPSLVTTDGRQQYLTKKGCRLFASRRRENTNALRQTWKEEDLKLVPKFYRQFAVEFNEENEH